MSDPQTLELHASNLLSILPRDGSTIDLLDVFLHHTMDMTSELLFGSPFSSLEQTTNTKAKIFNALHDVMIYIEQRWRRGIIGKLIPQPEMAKCIRTLSDFVDHQIEKGLRKFHDSDHAHASKTSKAEGRYVYLDELIRATDDRDKIRDEVMTILIAARDTTASLLSNIVFVLSKRKDVLDYLGAEIDELRGEKPSSEKLNQMVFLKNCINESKLPFSLLDTYLAITLRAFNENSSLTSHFVALRLFPPLTHNARVALEDVALPVGGSDEHASVLIPRELQYKQISLHCTKEKTSGATIPRCSDRNDGNMRKDLG